MHDLLRAYATELAHSHDDEEQRQTARHRALDYYLHAAHAAFALPHPRRQAIVIAPARPGVITERFADSKSALTWFTAEHRTLLAVNDLALRFGFDTHTWQLAWAMGEFLARSCRWPDHYAVQSNALRAAERDENSWAISQAHRALGLSNAGLGRRDDARRHLEHALHLSREAGDHYVQGQIHLGFAHFFDADGNYADALRHSLSAYDQFQAAGRPTGQASALNGIGEFHAKLGDYRQALSWCQQALAMLQELDDIAGAAHAMDSLAYVHHHLGDRHQAIACYQQARELHREAGDSQGEAEALTKLGDIHYEDGDVDAARRAWRQALDIFSQLDHPRTEQVRAKLTPVRALT